MEEIFKNFEAKKAEILKAPEVSGVELSPEEQKELLKNVLEASSTNLIKRV